MAESEFSPDEQNERRENPLGDLAQKETALQSEISDSLARPAWERGPNKSRWEKAVALSSMLFLYGVTTEMASNYVAAQSANQIETTVPADSKSAEERLVPEQPAMNRELDPDTKTALAAILSHNNGEHPGLFVKMISPEADFLDLDTRQSHSYDKKDLANISSPLDLPAEQLDSVSFFLKYAKDQWEAQNTGQTHANRGEGESVVVNRAKDKYNNTLIRSYRVNDADNTVSEYISINPPFLGAEPEQAQPQPWNFDLSPFGLPEVKGLLDIRPWPKNRKIGEYDLYTQQPGKELSETQLQWLTEVGRGQEAAEKLFGAKAGEQVKNMLLIHSEEKHGEAEGYLLDDTTIYSDTLMDTENRNVQLIGAHEAFHVIGKNLELSDQGIENEISKFYYQEMFTDFLPKLSESNFEKGLEETEYGHAQDNPEELFASLLNSVRSENWTERMAQADPEFRRRYVEALQAVTRDVKKCKKVSPSAPLLKLLKQRISALAPASPKPAVAQPQ